jgi:hypothetical protein
MQYVDYIIHYIPNMYSQKGTIMKKIQMLMLILLVFSCTNRNLKTSGALEKLADKSKQMILDCGKIDLSAFLISESGDTSTVDLIDNSNPQLSNIPFGGAPGGLSSTSLLLVIDFPNALEDSTVTLSVFENEVDKLKRTELLNSENLRLQYIIEDIGCFPLHISGIIDSQTCIDKTLQFECSEQ